MRTILITALRDTSKIGAATVTDDVVVQVLVILGLAIAQPVFEKAFEARRLVTLGL